MTFKAAVQGTPYIKDAWCPGLQAIKSGDKSHIDAEDTKLLAGSIDLDTTLRGRFPDESRWDYGIGHRATNLSQEVVYWVEIHPATTGDIATVLEKLRWLKTWLKQAKKLQKLRRAFVWVSSGRTSFTSNSPQAKQLAQNGLLHVGRVLNIPNRFVA